MFRLFFSLLLALVVVGFGLPASALPIHEQQIVEIIATQAALRNQVPRQDVEVEWLDNKLTALISSIPDGAVTIEVADSARLGGRGNVPVQILIDGKKFRTIFPKVDIRVYQQVLVSKVPISRGAQVNSRDVEVVRKAVSGYAQPLTSLDGLLGAEAVRDIPAGSPLTRQLFRIPPVVKMGDVVSVVLTSGGLMIITTGEARSAGAIGQVIRVLNPESKREYSARVVSPNRVEIKLED